MKFYLEITLLPNPEVNIYFLWSKVFQQIHLGLVEMQDDRGQVPIGISFPEYTAGEKSSLLGSKLRLIATDEETLSRLDVKKWLNRLSDYVHCTGVRAVPDKIKGYAVYQREQPKANQEGLARRYAKRHGVDYETALLRYSSMTSKKIATPFIRMKSLSSNQVFCLWIKKIMVNDASEATYSSYGLSAISSVPEF